MAKRPPRAVIAANQSDRSGTFLRAWRKNKGLSQEQLGDVAGFTQGMISQWENGASTLDLEHIDKLAYALEITRKQLMFRDPASPESFEDVIDGLPRSDQDRLVEIAKTFRRPGKPTGG